MVDLSSFVDQIKVQLKIKFLEIHLDSKFGSISGGHRENIRKHIVQTYSPLLSTWEKKAILDLVSLPVGENLFFSISHTKSIGGYAASDQRIGFDVEEVSRLTLETVSRISSADEVKACPDFKFLWSTKEALVKLAGASQKVTYLMYDFQLSDWQQIADQTWTFKATDKNNIAYKGITSNETLNAIPCTLAIAIYS